MKINDYLQDWLLDAEEPYIKYNAKQFLGIQADRSELLFDPFVKKNIGLMKDWEKDILNNHSKPQLLIHRLAMLADMGVKADDKSIQPVIKKIQNDFSDEGIPQIMIEIPKPFGGTGIPGKSWMICDYPVILSSLLIMGVKDERVRKGLSTLEQMVDENGYRCRSAVPQFRGPGKKDDFCPYVNIIAAKALSENSESSKSKAAKLACETMLFLWETRGQKKYFLFGIGTEFQKLKYPFVWYNILHMADVLSRYKSFHRDRRFLEMIDVILKKADENMRFRPESVYQIYKDQDFGNRKEHSRMITLAVLRILRRIGKV